MKTFNCVRCGTQTVGTQNEGGITTGLCYDCYSSDKRNRDAERNYYEDDFDRDDFEHCRDCTFGIACVELGCAYENDDNLDFDIEGD